MRLAVILLGTAAYPK